MAEWQDKRPHGRPLTYTRDVANLICAKMSAGASLRSICAADGMPPASTVRGWVVQDIDGFAERYARARDEQMANMAEELLEIADDGSRDYKKDADGRDVPDYDHIQRSKLRVDTRKWLLSKLMPKVYGDKVTTEVTGPGGGPLRTITGTMTPQEAAEAYADMLKEGDG